MQQASKQFTSADRERVAQAVRDAEAKTSVEIVPVVASSSGRYDRGEDICGLWCGVAAMVVVFLALPREDVGAGAWRSAPWIDVVWLVLAVLGGFLFGAVIATRFGVLKRLFTSTAEMREEVDARARSVFFDRRVHHTTGSTGLMIYVSLLEHRTAVISDQAVLDAIGQGALDALCEQLSALLRAGAAVDAICATIERAGEVLAGPLPRAADDVNELADALVTFDGLP